MGLLSNSQNYLFITFTAGYLLLLFFQGFSRSSLEFSCCTHSETFRLHCAISRSSLKTSPAFNTRLYIVDSVTTRREIGCLPTPTTKRILLCFSRRLLFRLPTDRSKDEEICFLFKWIAAYFGSRYRTPFCLSSSCFHSFCFFTSKITFRCDLFWSFAKHFHFFELRQFVSIFHCKAMLSTVESFYEFNRLCIFNVALCLLVVVLVFLSNISSM